MEEHKAAAEKRTRIHRAAAAQFQAEAFRRQAVAI
jgi:hypothetical protein